MTEALRDHFAAPNVEAVTPALQATGIVSFAGEQTSPQIYGVTPEYFSARNYNITEGELITEEHILGRASVVLLGPEVAETLFAHSDGVTGETVRIEGASQAIERRYVLRPTLAPIITTFAFLLINIWGGAPIFETVFNWPGLGRATFQAIGFYDTPVIVGTTIIFSYLLGITVFLLEFIYALVDPRVKIEGGGTKT